MAGILVLEGIEREEIDIGDKPIRVHQMNFDTARNQAEAEVRRLIERQRQDTGYLHKSYLL